MANKLPPQPLGVAPGSSYWNDWYEKLRSFVDTALNSTGTGLLVRDTGGQVTSIDIDNLFVNGTQGQTVTVTLAKLTGVGANGSLTFNNGVLISHIDPT